MLHIDPVIRGSFKETNLLILTQIAAENGKYSLIYLSPYFSQFLQDNPVFYKINLLLKTSYILVFH